MSINYNYKKTPLCKQEVNKVAVEAAGVAGCSDFLVPCFPKAFVKAFLYRCLHPLFLQVPNPAVTLSDSDRKKFQNFEWFNIVALLMASPPSPSSLFSFFSLSLETYLFEFTLFKFFAPNTSPGHLGASTNTEQGKKDFKVFFSLIVLVLATSNLVKLIILVILSTFLLLRI